ncbi:hypothetical protein SALBM217S_00658 [Streptomyces griseoloalbus]
MTAEAAAGTLGLIRPTGTYLTTSPTWTSRVEAVAEDLEVKRQLFATLDKVCKPGACPRPRATLRRSRSSACASLPPRVRRT